MTRFPRVLLIGRHFWPHASMDSAGVLFQIATGLHRRGVHVEVLTPRYSAEWPERIDVREIPVHRVVAAPRSEWSMGRYVRGLTTWLNQHASSFDVLLADSAREECAAVVEAARSCGVKSVIRCQGWGDHSDSHWWTTGRWARRCAVVARMSDRVIATSASCERSLLINGFDPARIERIVQGFSVAPVRSEQRRRAARHALATANNDLLAEPDALVILCNAKMVPDRGSDWLAQAAPLLVTRYPNLRLWLIGDGPARESIYQRLRADGVRASVAMPGSFSDSDDLFAAADVYFAGDEDGLEYFLPMAVSWELPIVAVDNAAIRDFVDFVPTLDNFARSEACDDDVSSRPVRTRPSSLIEWCDGVSPKSIRQGISRLLNDFDAARQRAGQLRRRLVRTRSESQVLDAYVNLIQRLAAERPPANRDPHAEALS